MKISRLEVLMIFGFFGIIILWTINNFYAPAEKIAGKQEKLKTTGPKSTEESTELTPHPEKQLPPAHLPNEKTTTLYVTADGLKLREKPLLSAKIVTKLALYQEVQYLNQKTEEIEEIVFGEQKIRDFWVKIRTEDNLEGWVFGAGVHYYKFKREM
jgi:hypothetical protein